MHGDGITRQKNKNKNVTLLQWMGALAIENYIYVTLLQ
jgi:hypothetical protein